MQVDPPSPSLASPPAHSLSVRQSCTGNTPPHSGPILHEKPADAAELTSRQQTQPLGQSLAPRHSKSRQMSALQAESCARPASIASYPLVSRFVTSAHPESATNNRNAAHRAARIKVCSTRAYPTRVPPPGASVNVFPGWESVEAVLAEVVRVRRIHRVAAEPAVHSDELRLGGRIVAKDHLPQAPRNVRYGTIVKTYAN